MLVETGGALIALFSFVPLLAGIIALIVQAARKGKKRVPVLLICFSPTMFIAGLACFMVESYMGAVVVFAIYAFIAFLCLRNKNKDAEEEQTFTPAQPYGMAQPQATAQQFNTAPAANTEGMEELKKYKALLDVGAITEEEFNAKKKQILGL